MKIEQVGIQLYTLRNHLETVDDIKASLKKVADIGFKAVELGGLGPTEDSELVKIVEGEGMRICSMHEDFKIVLGKPQKVVDRLMALGCDYGVYPYSGGIDFTNHTQVDQLVAQLAESGKVLRTAGKALAYHNHGIELLRIGNQTVVDYISAQVSPDYLQAEIDCYWIRYGGGGPVT